MSPVDEHIEPNLYKIDVAEPVGSGVTGARYCHLEGVLKDNGTGSYVVANEFICCRLGLLLGLPIPVGVITRVRDGDISYLSLRFQEREQGPPMSRKAYAERLSKRFPKVAPGAVAFDCWIGNSDRHSGNIRMSGGQPVLFDHSHALFGYGNSSGPERFENLVDLPTVGGFLAGCEMSPVDLAEWVSRIESIPNWQIASVCTQAAQAMAIPSDEANEARDFLVSRRNKVRSLLREAWKGGGLAGMLDWSLELTTT